VHPVDPSNTATSVAAAAPAFSIRRLVLFAFIELALHLRVYSRVSPPPDVIAIARHGGPFFAWLPASSSMDIQTTVRRLPASLLGLRLGVLHRPRPRLEHTSPFRQHHLLKTFWSGPHGWRDQQHPDGTITWTAPSGQTYTTRPGSRLLFPTLCLPTGQLPAAPTTELPPGQRGIMMPTRRRTRQQDRAYRISAERALNAAHVAERSQPPPF
jgi:hypothetical protein